MSLLFLRLLALSHLTSTVYCLPSFTAVGSSEDITSTSAWIVDIANALSPDEPIPILQNLYVPAQTDGQAGLVNNNHVHVYEDIGRNGTFYDITDPSLPPYDFEGAPPAPFNPPLNFTFSSRSISKTSSELDSKLAPRERFHEISRRRFGPASFANIIPGGISMGIFFRSKFSHALLYHVIESLLDAISPLLQEFGVLTMATDLCIPVYDTLLRKFVFTLMTSPGHPLSWGEVALIAVNLWDVISGDGHDRTATFYIYNGPDSRSPVVATGSLVFVG